jgi:hypothetical protein
MQSSTKPEPANENGDHKRDPMYLAAVAQTEEHARIFDRVDALIEFGAIPEADRERAVWAMMAFAIAAGKPGSDDDHVHDKAVRTVQAIVKALPLPPVPATQRRTLLIKLLRGAPKWGTALKRQARRIDPCFGKLDETTPFPS